MSIVSRSRSVIPAVDVTDLRDLEGVVGATCDVKGVGGYKVGMSLTERWGLRDVVACVKQFTYKPVIWDRQKAGTDIPDIGPDFAAIAKETGVSAVILFPFAGPETQERWTTACQNEGVAVITGGEMTHPRFLLKDGGYIADDAPTRIYELAAQLGVRDFVVPGNKPDRVAYYREMLESACGGPVTLYAPGFVAQGGEISEAGEEAGNSWHAIVGRAIVQADDIEAAARALVSQIV